MSNSPWANLALASFDIQRAVIRQGQQALTQSLALQRTANRLALAGLRGQEALLRQGTDVARTATHGSLQSMHALFGVDSTLMQAHHRTVDEQFTRFERIQSAVFDATDQQLELGIESFEDVSRMYVDALVRLTDQSLETLDTVEEQTVEGIEQFDEQVREQVTLTRDAQARLGDRFERQAEQTEALLQRLTEQIEEHAAGPAASRADERAADPWVENLGMSGSCFADRLREAGIETFGDLAEADPETVAEAAGVSVDRAEEWIGEASR